MKIEITTTPKAFEAVNVVIARAIESLERNEKIAEGFGLTSKDIVACRTFRKQLVKGFEKAARK